MRKTRWSRHEELLALGVLGPASGLVERIEMLLRRGREFSPRASRKPSTQRLARRRRTRNDPPAASRTWLSPSPTSPRS